MMGRRKDDEKFAEKDMTPWSDAMPELYSIHKATVKRVKPFGFFIQLEGFRRQGLVHWSQVSEDLHLRAEESDAQKEEAIRRLYKEGKVGVVVESVVGGEGGRKEKSTTREWGGTRLDRSHNVARR